MRNHDPTTALMGNLKGDKCSMDGDNGVGGGGAPTACSSSTAKKLFISAENALA